MADPIAEETITIYKGEPFHVDLPALDALHPIHYSRRLLIFRCDSRNQLNAQYTALQRAVTALVIRCPVLAGIVSPLPAEERKRSQADPNWRTIISNERLELQVKDLRRKLPSFRELEAANFPCEKLPYDLLVPVPQDIGNDRPFAACMLQFSAIEGGSILTWAMSHSVGDGSANNELMSILAEEVRNVSQASDKNTSPTTSPFSEVGLDRSAMRNMTSDVPFQIENHPGYMLNAPSIPPPHPFEANAPTLPFILHISSSRLAKLKSDAQEPDAAPISTHDALCALIWRNLILIKSQRTATARAVPPDTTVNLFFPSDARRHLDLPEPYIGNAVYQLSTALPLSEMLSPAGLRKAASAIRRTVKAVTSEKVRSVLAETNKNWVDWAFLGTYTSTGVPMGTDWTSSCLYDHDWGNAFGKVVRFRYPGEEGTMAILPKLPDGSAEMMVAVQADEVEFLRGAECFGQYLL